MGVQVEEVILEGVGGTEVFLLLFIFLEEGEEGLFLLPFLSNRVSDDLFSFSLSFSFDLSIKEVYKEPRRKIINQ